MWKRSYQKTFEKVTEDQIWDVLTDINNWTTWQPDLKYCKLLDDLKEGSYFELKPQKGPAVRIKILKLKKPTLFEDCTQFLGAKMHGIHQIEKVSHEGCWAAGFFLAQINRRKYHGS